MLNNLPSPISNVLDSLASLKIYIADDYKHTPRGELFVKMIDECLDMVMSAELEAGESIAPLDSTEDFMTWVFTQGLPSTLQLNTDMTPSAEIVAKLKPAFAVWLAKYNAYTTWLGDDDDENGLMQCAYNMMSANTYSYYINELRA
jgi:hypothetical protein